MSVYYIILSVVLALVCIATVVMILLQRKRTAGISGTVTGMSQERSFYDKNKGRTLDGQLEKWTKICAGAFMVLSAVLTLIK